MTRCAPGAPTLGALRAELRRLGDADIAAHSQRFFKTGPGEYGEGDRFRGIRVPVLRKLAARYRDLPLAKAGSLLASAWHEDRLTALLVLVAHYARARPAGRTAVYRLYLRNTAHVNNWDLVDTSAPAIVGEHLLERDRAPLHKLVRSASLWERRIAIIATQRFIRAGDFDTTLALAGALLDDREDLLHKAAGWMLREVGERDRARLEAFLAEHCRAMPRTMLRYALETLPPGRRRAYLRGETP